LPTFALDVHTKKEIMNITLSVRTKISATKRWLARLPYWVGVVVTASCIPFYIISFAQLALPIGTEWKAALWTICFGLAKLFQYCGLAILGAKGLSQAFKKR
jgi:phosphoglycolate phosphatase